MKPRIRVNIDGVDGETWFSMGTLLEHKKVVLQFLEKHDHEGSSVSLMFDGGDMHGKQIHGEAVYEYLRMS